MRRLHLLVGTAYLGVALWTFRAALLDPTHLAAVPALAPPGRQVPADPLMEADQRFVIGVVTRNARLLPTAPWRLFDGDVCHPTPKATTLGEHMIGTGLVAVGPWLVLRDPIAAYTAALVLTLTIAALAMYALALHFTGSVPAAAVAGLVFGFYFARLEDPVHPFVYANHWLPLALLFAARLVERRRWRDALGLAAALALQLLESFYMVLGAAIFGGTYGVFLLVQSRRSLRVLLPKVVLVAVVTLAVASFVFAPYLRTRAAWPALGDRWPMLQVVENFAPGAPLFPGWATLALAAIGLADRARRKRPGDGNDPRVAFVVASAMVWWSCVWAIPVPPWLGGFIPSPLILLRGVVPGLDAVRSPSVIQIEIAIALGLLAAFAIARGIAVRRRLGFALAALAAAAVLAERYSATLAPMLGRRPVGLRAAALRPADAALAAYANAPDGPLLDLPYNLQLGLLRQAEYVLASAYHRRPVGACYNSFRTPVQEDVQALANLLPAPGAADALHALGFRSLVLHVSGAGDPYLRRLEPLLRDPLRIRTVVDEGSTRVFALASPLGVATDPGLLTPPAAVELSSPLAPGPGSVPILFRNGGVLTYRTTPLLPRPLRVSWRRLDGSTVAEETVSTLLPSALGPGLSIARTMTLPAPAVDGPLELSLATLDERPTTVSRMRLAVRPAAPR